MDFLGLSREDDVWTLEAGEVMDYAYDQRDLPSQLYRETTWTVRREVSADTITECVEEMERILEAG